METIRVINLIQEKCKLIFEEKFKEDICKPYFIISQLKDYGYILTLILSDKVKAFDYRQSEFINLDTDLEKTIEYKYLIQTKLK